MPRRLSLVVPALIGLVLVVPAGAEAAAEHLTVDRLDVAALSGAADHAALAPSASVMSPATPRVVAQVEGVRLVEPAPRTLARGFHEGSTRSLPLRPVGRNAVNAPGVPLPEERADGPAYVVMPSRGRTSAPTSALDLPLPVDTPVRSVVTGTVTEVARYQLYGTTPDVMMTIRPDANPQVRIRLFHVADPRVSAGDRVVAGATTIAGASRRLPFASQVDRYTGEATPHVHVQVERI